MEYILGLVIVLNNATRLLGANMPQLLYIFSGFVFIWLLIRRNMLVKSIGVIFSVFVAYALLSQIITRSDNWKAVGVFLVHAFLNVTLMIWVVNNIEQLDRDKLIGTVAGAHLLLTVVALVLPNSFLWQYAEYFTGVKASRLRLLYIESAELSFVCGIFLLLCIYRMMAKKVTWLLMVSAVVFMVDMLISYGMAGMISFVIAVTVMIMAFIANNREKLMEDTFVKVKWAAVMALIFIVVGAIIIISPVYGLRVVDIVKGTDNGLSYTLQQPLQAFVYTMHATGWRGVGFGGLGSSEIGAAMGLNIAKNAFLGTMINGGALGVVFVLGLIFILLWMCLLYGNILNISFLIYAILFQFTSGWFDNPMNWFMYGIILVDCLKAKAVLEDKNYL